MSSNIFQFRLRNPVPKKKFQRKGLLPLLPVSRDTLLFTRDPSIKAGLLSGSAPSLALVLSPLLVSCRWPYVDPLRSTRFGRRLYRDLCCRKRVAYSSVVSKLCNWHEEKLFGTRLTTVKGTWVFRFGKFTNHELYRVSSTWVVNLPQTLGWRSPVISGLPRRVMDLYSHLVAWGERL